MDKSSGEEIRLTFLAGLLVVYSIPFKARQGYKF